MDKTEKMVADRLDQLAGQLLKQEKADVAEDLRRQSFQIYLSDPNSVRKGGLYFCGLKPYGARGKQYPAPRALATGFSTYRDAATGSPFYPRARKVIRHTLNRVIDEDAPLEAALCTNWFFQRAADTAQLKEFGLTGLDVSDVHRSLLDRYQPRVILCVGNGPVSAYRGFLDLLGLTTTDEERYLGNSYLRGSTQTGEPTVIGLPHLSRFPVNEQALDFVDRLLG